MTLAVCIHRGDFDLTEGDLYAIEEYDRNMEKVKVLDNAGSAIWVPLHFFPNYMPE